MRSDRHVYLAQPMKTLAVFVAAWLVVKALVELHRAGAARAAKRRQAIVDYLACVAPAGATGLAICKATRRASGTIYPDLARLEAEGRIVAWWETTTPGRPRRRIYGLKEPW